MKSTQSKDGTTLAYDVYGSGPALIYVTGASCYRSFKPVVHAQLTGQNHMVSAKKLLPLLSEFFK